MLKSVTPSLQLTISFNWLYTLNNITHTQQKTGGCGLEVILCSLNPKKALWGHRRPRIVQTEFCPCPELCLNALDLSNFGAYWAFVEATLADSFRAVLVCEFRVRVVYDTTLFCALLLLPK